MLCPVGGTALIDHAIERVRHLTEDLAVNVHALPDQLLDHLARHHHDGVVTSMEDEALGTAGAVGRLRSWIDGRAVVVVNGDTWCPAPLADLVAGWDGERVRVHVAGPQPFGPRSRIVASLMPWTVARELRAEPSGLYEVVWRAAHQQGRLETVHWNGAFVDCGTPADYLAANLEALAQAGLTSLVATGARLAGEASVGDGVVVGSGASVSGRLERCVVWPGARVDRGEVLIDAVRAGPLTVLVR